jgi:MoaA/NifB/PqqE/SkfB family radical SAM enzyme
MGVKTKIKSDFVVQLDNYQEIPAYFEVAKSLGFHGTHLGKMWNWDTWDSVTFEQKNVYNEQHPEYPQLLEIINKVGKDYL